MDGVAVRAAETVGASETTPLLLDTGAFVVVDTGDPMPDGFDAVDYLSRAMATLPRAVKTEILLHTDIATARREITEVLGIASETPDGVVVHGSADEELDWYARELMRLPFAFEIRAPAELRRALARLAAELASRFAA